MSEQDVSCPDPNEVVTRAILREELQEELANYPTKEDLRNELANYPTKEDLAAMERRLFEELTRQNRVLYEAMLAEMRVLFDPHVDTPKRIVGHDTKLDEHDAQLANHETRIVRLETPRPAKRRARTPRKKRSARRR